VPGAHCAEYALFGIAETVHARKQGQKVEPLAISCAQFQHARKAPCQGFTERKLSVGNGVKVGVTGEPQARGKAPIAVSRLAPAAATSGANNGFEIAGGSIVSQG